MRKKVPTYMRVILLAVISFGLLGFQSVPEYVQDAHQEEINNLEGWIDFSISGSASSDDGLNTAYVIWQYEQDILPVVLEAETGTMRVLSTSLYSVIKWHGTHAGGLGTSLMVIPIQWKVSGILYQDCSVKFHIDEIWYPGMSVVCITGICSLETVDSAYFSNAGDMTIPYEHGSETIVWDTFQGNVSGDLTIIIHSMTVGDNNDCSYIRQLP